LNKQNQNQLYLQMKKGEYLKTNPAEYNYKLQKRTKIPGVVSGIEPCPQTKDKPSD